MTIFSVFGLASCSNGDVDYTLDQTSHNKKIYQEWIKDVEWADKIKMDGDQYGPKATHYEIFLPKNIKASSRYANQSVEVAYDGDNKAIHFGYWALLNSQTLPGEILLQLSKVYNDTIKTAYGSDFTVEEKNLNSWLSSIDLIKEDLPKVEGKERGLSVLYMPIKIMLYLEKPESDAVPKIETYAIVPVYTHLGYLTNGKTDDEVLKNYTETQLYIGANGAFEDIEKEEK